MPRALLVPLVLLALLPAPASALSCRDRSVAELQLMTLNELDQEFCHAWQEAIAAHQLASLQQQVNAPPQMQRQGETNQRTAEQCDTMRDRVRLVLRSRHKVDPPECDGYIVKLRPASPSSPKKPKGKK